jgi:glycosyltransferase involved in cell wall biosynthesis
MVSVVIPTYNRAFCLLESIESVLTQSYTDLEVIVVDDHSSDDTHRRVLQIKDPRVRYVYNDKNLGAGISRNVGVFHAKGDFIAFQDSDDLWLKDKLLLQMRRLEETGADLCFCKFLRYGNEYYTKELCKLIKDTEPNLLGLLLMIPSIGTPTILVKKDKFLESGGFDPVLRCFEDYEFSLRFAGDHKISFVDKILCEARRLDYGVDTDQREKLKTLVIIFEKYFEIIVARGLVQTWVLKLNLVMETVPKDFAVSQLRLIRDIMKKESVAFR